jgi:hypothetical protein
LQYRRRRLDDATDEQLRHLRASTDHDVSRAAAALVALGALDHDDASRGTLRLTPLAENTLRARYGAGEQIAQVKITLLETDLPVWRRVLVPATVRLDRLDLVIQAAMGWTNSHLHMFIHPGGQDGIPDPTSMGRHSTNAGPPCAN